MSWFTFDPDPTEKGAEVKSSPEQDRLFERYLQLRLKPEEHDRLERLLLARLKERATELRALWETLNGHWSYENGFYRFYHGSFKVYGVQTDTDRAVEFLRTLLPERELNDSFVMIIAEGTGKKFDDSHNQEWHKQTRPILEAFAHARYMVEMAVRYCELTEPPRLLPNGYAALLYLYNMR